MAEESGLKEGMREDFNRSTIRVVEGHKMCSVEPHLATLASD